MRWAGVVSLPDEPLSLPPAPAPPARIPFPLVASLAPLAASAALWAVTRSPYAIAFAVLSPLIALATMADRRRQASRELKRALREREQARERLAEALVTRHDEERTELRRRHPAIGSVVEGWLAPGIWREQEPSTVALGTGVVPSVIRVTGEPRDAVDSALRAAARELSDAPVVVEAAGCIGIAGPILAARALARALVCRLAVALPPDALVVLVPDAAVWHWLARLPHASGPPGTVAGQPLAGSVAGEASRGGVTTLAVREEGGPASPAAGLTIALAGSPHALPPGTRTVVRFDAGCGWRVATGSPPAQPAGAVAIDAVSAEQSMLLADGLQRAAAVSRQGVVPLPDVVEFAALEQPSDPGPASLRCLIGETEDGPLAVDLVGEGPHAVVGGTTGSGKSELLVSWVCAMTATRRPTELAVLLVDFKGGAAFAPLAALPHCVGVISDLDPAGAARAVESLRAELRRREQVLAKLGAADVVAAGVSLGRLVVVVDEYASMVEAFPGFHALFADVTARGRSLGVHVILCTQRPAGVVRDAVLANCPLRLSLRVTSGADSAAVVFTDAAARLPAAPGRCVVVQAGRQRIAQVAVVAPTDVAAIADAAGRSPRPQRPWLEPLPAGIPLSSLPRPAAPAVVLGVEDVPAEQRQGIVHVDPEREGHLLVLGGRRSGRSGVLALVQRQCCDHVLVPGDAEGAWDAIARLGEEPAPATQAGVVLIDDLDVLPSLFDDEHRGILLERLAALVRAGGAARAIVVATAARVTGELRSLAPLFPQRLLLGMPDRREHVLADGDPGLWVPGSPPGAGVWRGRRIQLADAGALQIPESPPPLVAAFDAPVTVLVTRRPRRRAEALLSRGGVDVEILDAAQAAPVGGLELRERALPLVVVGDPEAWQSKWTLLGRLRESSSVLFDGCTSSELRAIGRSPDPAPAVAAADRILALHPDGSWQRLRWARE